MNDWIFQVDELTFSQKLHPQSQFDVVYGSGHFTRGDENDARKSIQGIHLRKVDSELFFDQTVLQVRVSFGGGYGVYTFSPVFSIDPFVILDPLPPNDYESIIAQGLFLRLSPKAYQEPEGFNLKDGSQRLRKRLQSRLPKSDSINHP